MESVQPCIRITYICISSTQSYWMADRFCELVFYYVYDLLSRHSEKYKFALL